MREYTMEFYTSFLKSFLNSLNIKECFLAGNSLGGQISWEFTVRYPKVIKRLILINSSGHSEGGKLPVITIARKPFLGEFLKFISPKSVVKKNLMHCMYDSTLVTPDLINRYHDLIRRAGNRPK